MAHHENLYIVLEVRGKEVYNVLHQKEDHFQDRVENHFGMDVPIEARIEDVAKNTKVKAALEKSIVAAVNLIGIIREDVVQIKENEV